MVKWVKGKITNLWLYPKNCFCCYIILHNCLNVKPDDELSYQGYLLRLFYFYFWTFVYILCLSSYKPSIGSSQIILSHHHKVVHIVWCGRNVKIYTTLTLPWIWLCSFKTTFYYIVYLRHIYLHTLIVYP